MAYVDSAAPDDGATGSPANSGGGVLSRPAYAAVIAFVLAASLAVGLIWRLEQDRRQEARRVASDLAAERVHDIQNGIDHVLTATYAMAAMVQQGRGKIPNFEATAGRLLRYYPGASALQLAPGGIVRQSAPLAGNEKAIGHDLLRDSQQNGAELFSRDRGELVLAGPFERAQGGLAAAGRLPVFLGDDQGEEVFWGLVIVLITFPDVLAPGKLTELADRGYAYELSRVPPGSDRMQVIAASSEGGLIDPVERRLQIANATWTLRVVPAKGWDDASGLVWKAALGLLFSLLVAWQAAWQAALVARAKAHERTLELRVAQRTADLQRFAEVTAHHLREPARRVVSYAGRLRCQLAGRLEDEELQLSLDFIGQQAHRLQDLLRDVELYLAADQPRGKVEPCDVAPALTALLATFADQLARAGATVTVGELPAVLIDRPRLVDLFRVALDNVLRHGRSERPLRVDIGGERLGRSVRFHISDNGRGIERAYRERVFRVFERLVAVGEGTGVGLAILRRITESAGGRTWLETTPGGGCRVVVELPAAERPKLAGQSTSLIAAGLVKARP